MARKERVNKWHEDIFTGSISVIIGITVLFNGFSYLTSLFLSEEGVEGEPTKQKGLVAFFSLLEGGWWKYFVVLIFLAIGFLEIRKGMKKFQLRK